MNCNKCYTEIPDESRFCMKCGAEQASQESFSGEVEPVYIPDDIRNLFFPLQGVTLGETTADEVSNMGIEVEDILCDGELSFSLYWDEDHLFGITFRQGKGKQYVNAMEIEEMAGLPTEWTQDFGIRYDMPYQEWLCFFKKYDFHVAEVHPESGFFWNLDILNAISADNRLQFRLMFSSQKSKLSKIYIWYGQYDT